MTDPAQRTADLTYGEDYWNSLDGGAGYTDSVLWEDLAVVVREVFGYDRSQVPWRDITSGMNHLDMGTAFGFLVRHLRRRNIESWGADVSEFCVTGAESDIRPYLKQFDLTGGSSVQVIPGWPFQLVTCFETMEHIPEEHVSRALTYLGDCLEHDGKLLLTICTSDVHGWETDPTHVTIKPREWWEAQLQAHGFWRCLRDEERLRQFYMFHRHNGVFVVSR